MNREEADRITGHLSDAEEALERASRAIAGLGSEERLKLGELLKNVVVALQSEVLAPIYEQHPDLEPSMKAEKYPTSIASFAGIRCAFRHR